MLYNIYTTFFNKKKQKMYKHEQKRLVVIAQQ